MSYFCAALHLSLKKFMASTHRQRMGGKMENGASSRKLLAASALSAARLELGKPVDEVPPEGILELTLLGNQLSSLQACGQPHVNHVSSKLSSGDLR